jgi:hypothetical protein
MTTIKRTPFKPSGPGPYAAIVKNHGDKSQMGQLEVALIQGNVDDPEVIEGAIVPVRYLSPFYGVTSYNYVKPGDPKNFNNTQKSYGMWMIPPDIGTRVLVIFINGDENQGFWIGCIQDRYQNYMVPGIAYQELSKTDLTAEQWARYGTTKLPVAEMNKKAIGNINRPINTITRPVHPFAERLLQQGLLKDEIRGLTSSSARREVPSSVFGISTPGPLDDSDTGLKDVVRYGSESATIPVSRLGGSTFVMDDGDDDGENELVRIRTRTGHQILLHNTKDLIYIANAGGTAWIEMTSNGKIDIFAQDSISIHSEQDFNLRAERNFNIEAGENVNIKAFNNLNIDINKVVSMTAGKSLTVSAEGNLSLSSNAQGNLYAKSLLVTGDGNLNLKSSGTVNIGGSKTGIATQVALNDSGAASATPASFIPGTKLPLFSLPNNLEGVGWGRLYSAGTVASILQRMPTHEPWSQHEIVNSNLYSSGKTNNASVSGTANPVNTPDSTGDILFTDGSGDAEHFAKLSSGMQSAVKKAASLLKEKKQKSMIITSSYRSTQEQQALYDRWAAAGGDPVKRPKAAGLYVPINPKSGKISSHTQRNAVDSPNADEMDRLGILAQTNLYRPHPDIDPVHIELVGSRRSGSNE